MKKVLFIANAKVGDIQFKTGQEIELKDSDYKAVRLSCLAGKEMKEYQDKIMKKGMSTKSIK